MRGVYRSRWLGYDRRRQAFPFSSGVAGPTIVLPPVATATGTALAPTDQLIVGVPVATATGVALSPFVHALPKLRTLKDDFNDNSVDTAKWTTAVGGTSTLSEANARIEAALPASGTSNEFAKLLSLNRFDLMESAVSIEVIQTTNTATNAQSILRVQDPVVGDALDLYEEGGVLYCAKYAAGWTTLASLTYVPATHRWWRISEASGTITFSTSPDGVAWTSQATTPTVSDFTHAQLIIFGWTYQVEASPGTFAFDNVNLAVAYPPVATSTGAALAPTIRAAAVPPTATATGAAATPTILASIPVPLSTATGTGLTPTDRVIAQVPAAAATGQSNAPAVIASVSVPLSTATGTALTPTDRLIVQTPVATAMGVALAPLLPQLPPTATATGAAVTPAIRVIVAPPVAAATGQANAPTVLVAVPVPLSTASGASIVPTVQALVAPPVATATGTALAPVVVGPAQYVQPPVATATGQAFAPVVQSGAGAVAVPTATATADATAPTISVSVAVPTAGATGAAIAPTVRLIISPPTATATAAAIGAIPTEAIVPQPATATGSAVPPTVQMIVVIPAPATATGNALIPTVIQLSLVPGAVLSAPLTLRELIARSRAVVLGSGSVHSRDFGGAGTGSDAFDSSTRSDDFIARPGVRGGT